MTDLALLSLLGIPLLVVLALWVCNEIDKNFDE